MPTQRTHRIEINYTEQKLIKLAARGMYEANNSLDHGGMEAAYGGFYLAMQNLIRDLCFGDPDFMELWNSTRIACSMDLCDWENYPEQIKNVLAYEGIQVILH